MYVCVCDNNKRWTQESPFSGCDLKLFVLYFYAIIHVNSSVTIYISSPYFFMLGLIINNIKITKTWCCCFEGNL